MFYWSWTHPAWYLGTGYELGYITYNGRGQYGHSGMCLGDYGEFETGIYEWTALSYTIDLALECNVHYPKKFF